MKKICLVSFGDIHRMPYVKSYTGIMKKKGIAVCYLYWDRGAALHDDALSFCDENIIYRYNLPSNKNKLRLMFGYIKCTKFFNNVLRNKRNEIAGVVFLESHAAVFCKKSLKLYKNRYIVDVRDYSIEGNPFLYSVEKKAINNSAFTVISSPAYKEFLPKDGDYVVSHNFVPFSNEMIKDIDYRDRERDNTPITISFIGTIRFFEMDYKLLSILGNDKRFNLNYFGKNSEIIENYCKKHNITNVSFHGSFSPSQTVNFYKNTDLINNLYGNNNKFLDYALSNKLYHAVQLRIPILVCQNTFMEDVINEYGLGKAFLFENKNSADDLYSWFKHLDRDSFNKGCARFLDTVRKENIEFELRISHFLDSTEAYGENT